MRHIPFAIITLAAMLCLAGCGGDEAQATSVILANSAGVTATAVARSINATTTAALGQVPSVGIPSGLPGASGVPSLPSALPSAPSASAASPPPLVATLIPSGAPTPGGSRPTIVLPTAQASGSGPGGTLLPAGFPLPSGYTLVSNLESDGQIVVVLSVSSAKDAYDFYKGALPGAGYQVTDQGSVNVPGGAFVANLTISNATYDGSIAFTPGATSGQTVTIQLRRK